MNTTIEVPFWLVAVIVGMSVPFLLSFLKRVVLGLPIVFHCIAFLRAARKHGTSADFWHALRYLPGTVKSLYREGSQHVRERLTERLMFDFRTWSAIVPYMDEYEWAWKLWQPLQKGTKTFNTSIYGTLVRFHRINVQLGAEYCPALFVEFSGATGGPRLAEHASGEFAVALVRFMEMMREYDASLCGVATLCTDHIPHISTMHPVRVLEGWHNADIDFYDARKELK